MTRKVVIKDYRLTKKTDKAEELVWQKTITFTAGVIASSPRFMFWDAELEGEKIYVLYTEKDYARLDVMGRDSGKWTTVKSQTFDDSPRSLRIGRFFRDAGGLGIRYVGVGHREEKWDVRDDVVTPRKKKERPK